MPSPFPGMDPYLEDAPVWSDFHLTTIIAIRAELNTKLPARYFAAADRHVWIHEPEDDSQTLLGRPDVMILSEPNENAQETQGARLAAPTAVVLPAVRHEGSPFIRIVDRENRRVITVIEMLSPSNKSGGEDFEAYLMKRNDYLASRVSLVEIDLLREGGRMPFGEPPPEPGDYYVLVCRSWEMPHAGIWPLTIRNPLPDVPIPLTREENEIMLPLQKCVNRAYDEGRYARELHYNEPPEPPLAEPDATWARELLSRQPT